MAGRDLVLSELNLLGGILSRRDPDLLEIVERADIAGLTNEQRERVRRAIVDELCELPEGSSGRHALELEELLIRLGRS